MKSVEGTGKRGVVGGSRWWLVAAAILHFAVPAPAAGQSAAPPSLPPAARTKQRSFSIPFTLPPATSAETAPREIVMDVSKDLGVSWESAGRAAPSATSLTYTAPADGEYWFRLRTIDSKGRLRGGAGADMRVIVDAAGPSLVGRAWKGSDGEVLCRFAALDDSINLDAVVVEYHSTTQPEWKRVASQPVLARESPAHLLGEEIWWAGEKTDGLVVRVTVADSSGNRTVKQFPLAPADPGVDQATLAGELGVPALPGAGGGLATLPSPHAPAIIPPAASPASSPLGMHVSPPNWPAESIALSPSDPRRNPLRSGEQNGVRSVLAGRPTDAAPPSPGDSPLKFAAKSSASGLIAADPPRAEGLADLPRGPDGGLEYRGRPLQIVRSRRFAWDYELPAERPSASVLVELWGTRDGGFTWTRIARDDDATSPIPVLLPEAGLYGFRLEITADGEPSQGPRAGEPPDSWVGVDEEPPRVEILGIDREKPQQPSAAAVALRIRYSSRDPLLVPGRTTISYAPSSEGPWAAIVEDTEDSGEYAWAPDRTVPSRVFIRVESRDAAGNVGGATSPEPVVISTPKAVGRLGGIHVASPDAANGRP